MSANITIIVTILSIPFSTAIPVPISIPIHIIIGITIFVIIFLVILVSLLTFILSSQSSSFLLFLGFNDTGICQVRRQRFEELHFNTHLDFSTVGQALLCVTHCLVKASAECSEKVLRSLALWLVVSRRRVR